MRAVREKPSRTDEGKARTHVRSGAERNVAGVFRCGNFVIGEFVRSVIGIEKNVGKPEIAGDDAITLFHRRTIEKKRGHPFSKAQFPEIDKRTS